MSRCGGVRDRYCKLSDFTVEKRKKKRQYVPFLVLQVCFKMLGRNNVGIFSYLKCFYVTPKPLIQSFSVPGFSQDQCIEHHIYI